jgi:DNA-binding NarL/FixJ family response regulator
VPIRGGQPIRLGIVDDHPVFRLGLKRTLEHESDLKVLWELGTATEVVPTMRRSPVDAILMDLNLGPGQDSLAATRAVLLGHPRVRVIVISAILEPEAASAAKAAGASGYIPKDLAVPETVAAIKSIMARRRGDLAFADFFSSRSTANGTRPPSNHGLTKREQEVVVELRRGRTNREIAARLGVSTATVNKHVQHVLKKLHVKSRGQAIARLHAEAAGRPYT